MLLVLSKPASFQDAVTHITMGKWCKMGLMILSKDWATKREQLCPGVRRGSSTVLGTKEATANWRGLKKSLPELASERAKCLKKLKLKEEDTWGEGLLMFGPCKRETLRGLKCRCLPLVHENTPVDSFKCTMLNPVKFRGKVNNIVTTIQRKWIAELPVVNSSDEKIIAERLLDCQVCSNVIKSCTDSDENSAETWQEVFMPKDTNRSQGEAVLA